MPHHRVAGTTLTSDVDLEVPAVGEAALGGWTVRVAEEPLTSDGPVELNRTHQDDGSTWSVLERTGRAYELRFPGLVSFRIDPSTSEVRYEAYDDHPDTLRHLILDQLTPHLLALHGALVLHAAGVVVDGVGLAILGPSGTGKSTLAGALVRRGALLLADDFLVLSEVGPGWTAQPSYPGLRLWEDSADALGSDATTGPVSGCSDKRRWQPGHDRAAQGPAPIGAVVVMAEGDPGSAPVLAPMRGAAAYIALYEQAFRVERRGRSRLEGELDRFDRLVGATGVHRLAQRYRWDELEQVTALVEALAADISSSRPDAPEPGR